VPGEAGLPALRELPARGVGCEVWACIAFFFAAAGFDPIFRFGLWPNLFGMKFLFFEQLIAIKFMLSQPLRRSRPSRFGW
jgi:hypothetical protein